MVFMLSSVSACRTPITPVEPVIAEPIPVSTPASTPMPAPMPEPEPTPEPTPEIIVVNAVRSDMSVSVDEVPITLCLYDIDGLYFLNLFEFALILSDFGMHFFPEWVYINNILHVSSESSYVVEDLTFSHRNPDIISAKAIDVTVFLDGSEVFISAYLIENDVIFELNAIAEVLDLIIDNDFEGGVIKIFTNQTLADRAARIKNIDPSRPMIALTFDDGPSATTIDILDILEESNVVATFYVLGSLLARHNDTVLRAHNMGCEIANHTWSHISADKASADSIRSQLQRTGTEVESIIGVPTATFRPPFGSITKDLQNVTGELGYPIILWSIDPSDYLPISSERIYNHIMERVQDRDIILLHDLYDRTLEATRRLVPSLIEQGFQFVTVSELFHFSGITPNPGDTYRHGR
jgi:peptidoglycan/xylan/chitin deacetylase (PgdA/CDA1 family)